MTDIMLIFYLLLMLRTPTSALQRLPEYFLLQFKSDLYVSRQSSLAACHRSRMLWGGFLRAWHYVIKQKQTKQTNTIQQQQQQQQQQQKQLSCYCYYY